MLFRSGQTTVPPPGRARPAVPSAPRVTPLPRGEWTDAQKALVEKHARYGEPDNAVGTLLRVPELFDGVMPYTIYLSEDSSLTPRQRELLILRAAWLTGTPSLWARHAAWAKKAGMTDADIKAVYAFLMTRTPVKLATPENELRFPYNVRALVAGWKLLFLKIGRAHV